MKIEMGKVYWKSDGSINTFETLSTTLTSFGIRKVKQKPLGREFGFERVVDWETPTGLQFSTIWYVNLSNIRFGNEWEDDLGEIMFDEIRGSYLPYADHDTIDFAYKGNTMFRLALKSNE